MYNNKELIERVLKAQAGDKEYRDKIIELFYPSIVNKAKGFNILSDDLVGVGTLYLLKAIKNFDISKSNGRFTSYAWAYILNGMRSYQGKYASPVTMPTLVNADIGAYNRICDKYFSRYGEYPLDSEIQSMSGWGKEKFEYISNIVNSNYGYYDNDTITYKNQSDSKHPVDVVNNKVLADKIIEYALCLPQIESEIFILRNVEGKLYKDIAAKYGVTIERVRQLSEQALFKIRRGLGNMK